MKTNYTTRILLLFIIFYFSIFNISIAQTGTWTELTNLAPHPNLGVMLLLTDGTVICHNTSGGPDGSGWDRLTPDIHGSYANGTWTSISNMQYGRTFFSSQVLPSGKVWVAGGEYGPGDTAGEMYDPVANVWSPCHGVPSGWNLFDANSELLYNGICLQGPQLGANPSYNNLFMNPNTQEYSVAPNSLQGHDESAWLKLPDSSVLFIGIQTDNSNRYIPQTNTWVNDDIVPGNIYDGAGESGTAFMLPNGKAIFFGATSFNAFYTPSGNSSPGVWTAADSFPIINGKYVGQPDAAGAMMVNGHILLAVSPAGSGNIPCYFIEYDYTANTFTQVKANLVGWGGDSIPGASYQTQMLDLPDGTVLLSVSQSTATQSETYYVYTPGSGPIPQSIPAINNVVNESCNYYMITGKLFNGISEGASFGDDWQMATNYPIVRITNGTNVYYAKTTNWNRIGAIQTDSLEDTAYFTFPMTIPAGTYSLVIVANGSPSKPTLFISYPPISALADSLADNGGCNGKAWIIASGGNAPYTYSWANGKTTDTISNECHGSYCCFITDANGCVANICLTIDLNTDVNKLSNSSGISIYPNPGNGIFTIQSSAVSLASGESWSVEVNDVFGEKVYSNSYQPMANARPAESFGRGYQLDLHNKPNGIYFYRVFKENGSILGEGKLVIIR